MSIVRSPMHLATCNDIDAGDLLFQNCGLSCAKLCVSEIARCELSQGDQSIERLVPPGHAMRTDNGGRIFLIMGHRRSFTRPGQDRFSALWWMLYRLTLLSGLSVDHSLSK